MEYVKFKTKAIIAIRAFAILLNRDRTTSFHILTDTLQLQRLGNVQRLSVNTGTMLHTGSHHYVAIACLNERSILNIVAV